ncbi:uncharacterized protein LOC124266100 [Haliotis rubra]|uniref:uncharacterized protein LOC124266100 n=1 Tax=Haliotis rubra TaxID=36100 RepID=UPI001EE55F4B|nr:uncharacterized protein LOC124266100 [Haliotis rubra]
MVLQPAVNELKLPSTPDKVLLTTIRQDPFWCTGFNVDLQISTTDHPDLRYDITGAFSADNLCLSEYNYPVRELQATYPHLRDLPLPTISQACHMILIGSDHADLTLPQKPVVFGADGSPVAICTLLGWTLQGPTKEISPQKAVQSYYTALERKATLMNHVERLWQLDVLPYSEKKVERSKQDIEALHMLEAQTELVMVDGVQRYATPLLRAKDAPKFEATEAAVMPILKRTEKRLARNPDLADIHNHLIEKLVTAGYVRILTPDEIKGTESWYFPHHVVDHNGKYRLVFNCSYNSADLPADAKSDACELWLNFGKEDSLEATLGLQWQCKNDMLCYKFRQITYHQLNMRVMYKILASQYDPLGYLSPYLARAKIIVQDLWKGKVDWDTTIETGESYDKWNAWERELADIKLVKIPRCYTPDIELCDIATRQIHVFCDASERIYGAVAYLRTTMKDQTVSVTFIAARSRVAPKKQQTIPRLELSAALTGAQLADVLLRELTLPVEKVMLWSDSTTVLAWIHSESCRYKVFVGTRVAEVQTLTKVENWLYVNTKDNPADCITRGLTIQELIQDSKWSCGPAFLYEPPEEWTSPVVKPVLTDNSEVRNSFCGAIFTKASKPLFDDKQYDSWNDLVVTSIAKLHGAADSNSISDTVDQTENVENKVYRQIQEDSFPEEISNLVSGKEIQPSSRLLPLSPVYDSECGLIRIGGRLTNADCLSDSVKHPIILDPHHHLTKLLIRKYDEDLKHPGPERVLAEMRRTFWILRGREAIKKHQHNCTECQRWRGKPVVPKMNDLPKARLRLYKPVFYSTGIDCFGPMSIKIGRRVEKRWGVLFKCMTTRAIHLELLDSLSTDAFLMAFWRFISRRGKPFEVLSDQGTNFKGADAELQRAFSMMEPVLIDRLSEQKIRWKYNPPNSPHFGGVWEREIKSLKSALRVILRDQCVSEAVLHTVLVEIEGILNSKPLGYTSSDVRDIDPITPNLLLMGRRDPSLPQVVYPVSELMGRRRWRHSQVIADQFWVHFIKYYLPDLQLRRKWTKETGELTCGDIVLMVDPQLSRAQWPVGKIVQTFPSKKLSDIHVKVRKKSDGLLIRNRIHVNRLKHGLLRVDRPDDPTPPVNIDSVEPAILGVEELPESCSQRDSKGEVSPSLDSGNEDSLSVDGKYGLPRFNDDNVVTDSKSPFDDRESRGETVKDSSGYSRRHMGEPRKLLTDLCQNYYHEAMISGYARMASFQDWPEQLEVS